MTDWLIKLLGGYTKNEYETLEDAFHELEDKIFELKKKEIVSKK